MCLVTTHLLLLDDSPASPLAQSSNVVRTFCVRALCSGLSSAASKGHRSYAHMHHLPSVIELSRKVCFAPSALQRIGKPTNSLPLSDPLYSRFAVVFHSNHFPRELSSNRTGSGSVNMLGVANPAAMERQERRIGEPLYVCSLLCIPQSRRSDGGPSGSAETLPALT